MYSATLAQSLSREEKKTSHKDKVTGYRTESLIDTRLKMYSDLNRLTKPRFEAQSKSVLGTMLRPSNHEGMLRWRYLFQVCGTGSCANSGYAKRPGWVLKIANETDDRVDFGV